MKNDKNQDYTCLMLLAEIREVCGDNGKRMQPELVKYIGELYEIAKKVIDINKMNTLDGVSQGIEELAIHVKNVLELRDKPTKEVLTSELTKEDDEINYVVHYKWQEGAELFFDKLMIKGFKIRDKNCLDKLEQRLTTILSNTGMREENLATVQITGVTQL
jgi:hypothetical protein